MSQRYVRIEDGIVVEIVDISGREVPTLIGEGEEAQVGARPATLEDLFHPDFIALLRPSETAEVGWVVDGGELIPSQPPEEPAVDLVAYAADARWRREVGGVVVASVPIATDDRSKMMILGARVAAAADPEWSTVWHGADGNTYPLDAAAMIAISDAVQGHVNGSFATFAEVKAAIESGDISTMAEINAAFAT